MKIIGDTMISMNKGLMNIIGNFMRIVKTIVFPGVSVEGTESMRLKQENANPANIIPTIRRMKLIERGIDKNNIPKIRGMEENDAP